jgi:hypothetical protein
VRPNDVSVFLPTAFEEQFVRLYIKRKEIRHIATAAFAKWSEGSFPTNKSVLYSPARVMKRNEGETVDSSKILLRNSSLSSHH